MYLWLPARSSDRDTEIYRQVQISTNQNEKLNSTPSEPQPGFNFSLIHFGHFLLRQIGCWDILVICLTVVFKLAVAVFISLNFQTFWPKWLNFFRSFWKNFGIWPKNTQAATLNWQNANNIQVILFGFLNQFTLFSCKWSDITSPKQQNYLVR